MAFKDADGHTVNDTVEHIRTGRGSCCNTSRTNIDETAAQTLVHIRDTPTNDLLQNLKRKRVAKKTETRKNKHETEAQKNRYMKQYLTNQTPWTYNRLKGKSYEEIVNLYRLAREWNEDFIPMYSAEESRRFKIGGFEL